MVCFLIGCKPIETDHQTGNNPFAHSWRETKQAVLEIGLIQLDDTQSRDFEEYWTYLDQQKIPLGIRQAYDSNGMRLAVMNHRSPRILNQLTAPRPIELESLDPVEQQMAGQGLLSPRSRLLVHKQIVNRPGKAYQIETSDVYPEYDWTLHLPSRDNGDRRTLAGGGSYVQGSFKLLTHPVGDGSIRIQATPFIHSGPIMPAIGVVDGGFAYDTDRMGQSLNELAIEVVLRKGETLVVAPSADCEDLGKLFFGLVPEDSAAERTPRRLTHRVLLIRLLNSPSDELFGDRSPATLD